MSESDRPLVSARGLRKSFRRRDALSGAVTRTVHAVAGVDLEIRPAEIVGLVGESGSGKSTLGKLLIRLLDPDEGAISFDGVDLLGLRPAALRAMRSRFQIVFQDAYGSLNPRMRVGDAIAEPLVVHKLVRSRVDRRERVAALLGQVGLDRSAIDRYPHEFSGGQRQRIGIARAVACGPQFIVADEPVSALDPPVQAQIVNLLLELQREMGLAYLFVSHDLRLVEHICDRVAVMYLGAIVEQAPSATLYRDPLHPYTRALLAATPSLDPGTDRRPAIQGEPPSPGSPPDGCPFHPRCPLAVAECARKMPRLVEARPGHRVACHLVDE